MIDIAVRDREVALDELLDLLQLPQRSSQRPKVQATLQNWMDSRELTLVDAHARIAEEIASWRESGAISPDLSKLIVVCMRAGLDGDVGQLAADQYPRMLKELRGGSGKRSPLSVDHARRLLSRLDLISHLLREEKMSCTQVSRVLIALEPSLDVGHQVVAVIARRIKSEPALSMTDVMEGWEQDSNLAQLLFPDSSIEETSTIAALRLEDFLGRNQVIHNLTNLASPDWTGDVAFWPYIQILHYSLVPVTFYDHPPFSLYEFSPRGKTATAFFERYPAKTGNPFLNNAKAVQTLNRSWAMTRGGTGAQALVDILDLLSALPYALRDSASKILRAWCIRILDLLTVNVEEIALDGQALRRVVERVAVDQTGSRGVIEQKLVDGLAYVAFGGIGSRALGIGDSVNASNLSRKKLGDVEFVNVDERSSIAVEAHAGHLSEAYVKAHLASLRRGIDLRLSTSWAALDSPEAWSVRVVFVAHSWATGLPVAETVEGVTVHFDYWSYDGLVEQALKVEPGMFESSTFVAGVRDAFNSPKVSEVLRAQLVLLARPS